LFLAIVCTLAGAKVESLADLLRAFNYQNGVHVAYKAFYNRLARPGFAVFMRGMCVRLVEHLRGQTLVPEGQRAVARFKEIVIHDGSSFALKPSLREVFPGRFTALEPAAVEIHATYSGFADEVQTVHVAPDCDAERQFLPDPATLTGCLLLADRGYPSVPYFEAVQAARSSCASPAAMPRGYVRHGSKAAPSPCRRGCGCRACSPSMQDATWTSTSSLRARTAASAFAWS
jgi:hypothetical protein